jgi:hypothetical protein
LHHSVPCPQDKEAGSSYGLYIFFTLLPPLVIIFVLNPLIFSRYLLLFSLAAIDREVGPPWNDFHRDLGAQRKPYPEGLSSEV